MLDFLIYKKTNFCPIFFYSISDKIWFYIYNKLFDFKYFFIVFKE